MKIAVAGSTGFLGSALVPALVEAGHEVLRLVRPDTNGTPGIRWDPAAGTIDAAAIEGVDAIINLAGRGIGRHRLTRRERERLTLSRLDATGLLARTAAEMTGHPRVFINASAIGFYGDRGDELLDERSAQGEGFLADLCGRWERSAEPAAEAGIRVVRVRTGIVLGHGGPLFRRLIPAFKLGLGGRLGNGRQYQSWISLDDEVGAIIHLLGSDVAGPVNLTAPEPVTNTELVRTIGRAMHRPSRMVVPRIAVAAALGGAMADDLLASQRVLPTVLQRDGFSFESPKIEQALAEIFG